MDKEIIVSELKRISKAIDEHPKGGLNHAIQ